MLTARDNQEGLSNTENRVEEKMRKGIVCPDETLVSLRVFDKSSQTRH